MITLFSPLRVISVVATAYAASVILALFIILPFEQRFWPLSAVQTAFSGAVVLDFFLILACHLLWRKLWAAFPILNTMLFPDLNGEWRMKIHWSGVNERGESVNGTVNATANIEQNLLRLSMEVESRDSDSETLMTKPKKDPESGRPILYYVYRVIPKRTNATAGLSYEGAAILKFDVGTKQRLAGNYFTSRMRQGYFTLDRS